MHGRMDTIENVNGLVYPTGVYIFRKRHVRFAIIALLILK